MQLVTKFVVAATGAFVISGAIVGIVVQLSSNNDSVTEPIQELKINEEACLNGGDCNLDELCSNIEDIGLTCVLARDVLDCSTVECEEHLECSHEDGKSPACTCNSAFVTLVRRPDGGISEKVCPQICEDSSHCKKDEVCKEEPNSGIFCVASADLDTCDESIKCESPEVCHLVNSHPKCKCPFNELLIETETNGILERRCHKPCETSSDCEINDVCKDIGSVIICIASEELDSCYAIQCDDTQKCELFNDHPKCMCPLNELLVVTETYGSPERRCLKTCITTDDCEAGTLCFDDSIFTQLYCKDRDRIEQCSDAVECTPETECHLTIELKIECLCKNKFESTDIESTESGSTRTCKTSTCGDSNGCPRTELCLKDKYSKQGYCQVRGNECTAEVECDDSTSCKLNTDGFAECLCDRGYTEIEAVGLTDTTRICHTYDCTNSDGCGERQLCYRDETSKELYCADSSRGCGGAVCDDQTECVDTLKGYSKCECSKGYPRFVETMYTADGETSMITSRICEDSEKSCFTSNDCKEKFLCYFNSPYDQSGFCATRLKGCTGVECPTAEADTCRVAPSGFAECLCAEDEYTAVYSTEIGGTTRKCHTLPCATSNDCDGSALCYKDSITFDFFCDNTPTVCTSEVQCPDGFHCDDAGGQPQCVCDDATQATQVMPKTDENGRNLSERFCRRRCADSDDCFPGDLCHKDDTFVTGNGCHADKYANCSDVVCPFGRSCPRIYTECICDNGAPTIVKETDTGSERVCDTEDVRCESPDDCAEQGNKTVCLIDQLVFQARCVDPSTVDSCDNVQCVANMECNPIDKSCVCRDDERFSRDNCYKECTSNDECEMEQLGYCIEPQLYCMTPRKRYRS